MEVREGGWDWQVWFEISWKVCKVLSSIFIALNVNLSFAGEAFYCCAIVLVSFDVTEENGYGNSSYGLIDFVA